MDHDKLWIDIDVAAFGIRLDRTAQFAIHQTDNVGGGERNITAGAFGRFGTHLAVSHEKIVSRTEVDRSGIPCSGVLNRDGGPEKGEVSWRLKQDITGN
ncbi:MAG: hypothetical protein EHM35_03070 [Planctomycetaceae bacterium]|nr:MAG: hypothetical protein EHM35_03070 [Planctomycetaceae bacterium]